MRTYTYSYAILPVSRTTYDEILKKFKEADYDHAIDIEKQLIDMHGVALELEEAEG